MTIPSKKYSFNLDDDVSNQPLSDEELDALAHFLSELEQDEAPSLSSVDGFFNALAITPDLVPAQEWLVWVLGEMPNFSSEQQAQLILSLLTRHHHQVQRAMRDTNPPDFSPLFLYRDEGEQPWVSDWCHGFMAGMHIRSDAWLDALPHETDNMMLDLLFAMTVLAPPGFEQRPSDDEVGDDDVDKTSLAMRRMVHKALDDYRAHFDPLAGWEVLVEVCVMHLRDHLLHPRSNNTCPCGSGQPFEECCGSSNRQLH